MWRYQGIVHVTQHCQQLGLDVDSMRWGSRQRPSTCVGTHRKLSCTTTGVWSLIEASRGCASMMKQQTSLSPLELWHRWQGRRLCNVEWVATEGKPTSPILRSEARCLWRKDNFK
eukprot:189758-Amphidinium_carterae.2